MPRIPREKWDFGACGPKILDPKIIFWSYIATLAKKKSEENLRTGLYIFLEKDLVAPNFLAYKGRMRLTMR